MIMASLSTISIQTGTYDEKCLSLYLLEEGGLVSPSSLSFRPIAENHEKGRRWPCLGKKTKGGQDHEKRNQMFIGTKKE